MDSIVQALTEAVAVFRHNMPLVLILLGVLWSIHVINAILGYRLNILGVHPRRFWGLPGIFFSPFLHGDFSHIFFNSIPFVILASCVMISGLHVFIIVSITITLLSGTCLWLFGRKAIHIGASGLIMGYLGFLLMNIYQQGTVVAVAIGIICIYYLGGMLFSIFPTDVKTSWEGHLFGLLAGVATSYLLPTLLMYASS